MAGTPIEILIKAMGAEEVVTALKKVTSEGANVKKSLTDTGASLDTLGTKAKGPLGNIQTQLAGTTKSTNEFSGVLRSTNPTLNDFSKNFEGAAAGAPKLTTALDQTSQKTQTLTERGRGLSSSFQSTMASTVALTGTAIALFETWDSVSDSELAVEKARTALGRSTVQLQSYERLLAAEVAKNGANSLKAIEYQDRIAVQREDIKNKTGDLANAEENLAIIQTHFYKEIIPLTMAAGASMFQMFTTGRGALTALGSSFKGIIPAIQATNVSLRGLALNPILLPLTAISAVLVLFTTNMFGVRDAINAAGKAIGDFLPFLRPFLDLLGTAGKVLTDTFGGGAQEAHAFDGELSDSMGGATASVQGFADDGSAAMGDFAKNTGDSLKEVEEDTNEFGEKIAEEHQDMIKRMTQTADNYIAQADKIINKFNEVVVVGKTPLEGGFKGQIGQPLENYQGNLGSGAPYDKSLAELMVTTERLDDGTKKYITTKSALDDLLGDTASVEQRTQAENLLKDLGIELVDETFRLNDANLTNAETSKAAGGSMKAQIPLIKDTTGATGDLTDAAEGQTVATTILSKTLTDLTKKHSDLMTVYQSSTKAQDMMAIATKQVQVDFMAMSLATAQQNLYLQQYEKMLKTVGGQIAHFQKGVVGQRQALLDSKITVLETTGAYSELLTQMQTGEPQTLAYTQTVLDQKIALEQSKIEVYALQGTLDTLSQQYNSGEQSVVAFNKGFIEQKTSLLQTAIAVDTTRGAIMALAEEIVSGNAQIVAWNTGLAQGRLATQQQSIAVDEAAGSLTAYQESIASGVAGETAFSMAIWETNRAIAEAFVNLEASKGALQEYNHLVSQGIPQYNAYHQTILDTQMAHAKLGETVYSTLATYEQNIKALNDTTIWSQKAGIAFLEGKDSAIQWAESIKAADFAQGGMLRGLHEVDHAFGTILPQNMALTEDSAKRLIIAFGNVHSASAQMASEGYKAGLGLTSGIADALKDGEKSVKDGLEELEIKLGREFPDSVKAGIVSANIGKTISETLVDGLNVARVALAGGAKTLDIQRVVNGLGEDFKAGFDDMSPIMQKSAAGVMAKINYELAQGPDKNDPNGVEDWFNRIESLALALPDQVDPAASSIENLANVDFSGATSQLLAYKDAIDSTVASYQTFHATEDDKLQFSGGVGIGTGAKTPDKVVGDAGTVTAPAPDTSAIDAAQVKLDTFKTALTALPGFISGQVTAANTSFLPLGDPFLNEIPTKILNFSTTLQSMPTFISASVVAPVNTALSVLGDPFLTTIPAKILQFSQTLAQMPGFVQSNVVSPIISNFTGMANALVPIFNRVQTTAAVAFQAITNIARAEAPKLAVVYDNAITAMITKFAAIGNAASRIFPQVTQWAAASAQAVQNLAEAINALQDKTVTLTTVYESVYTTRTAATGFGPAVVDKPTRLLVGESGPEFVQVMPLSSGANKNLDPNQRLEMYADPGKTRNNTDPLFELAHGNSGFNGDDGDPSNVVNSLPNSTTSSNWVDVNIVAVGGRNVSTTGNAIPIFGGSGGGSSIGGGSSSGGGGSSGGGSGSGGGGGGTTPGQYNFQQNINGVQKYYRYNNGAVDTNMTDAEIQQYIPAKWRTGSSSGGPVSGGSGNPVNGGGGGSSGGGGANGGSVNGDPSALAMGNYEGGTYKTVTGYTVPNFIQSPGHGATNPAKWSNPNMDPRSWRAVRMVDDPSLWKVVDDKGVNIAAKFVEEDQANEFIQEHMFAAEYPDGNATDGLGGNNNTPGGNNNPAPQQSSQIKTSGSGSRWGGDINSNPESWQVVPMVDDPSKLKVVDSNGKNLAVGFNSEDEAGSWIEEQRLMRNDNPNMGNSNTGVNNNSSSGSSTNNNSSTNVGGMSFPEGFPFNDTGHPNSMMGSDSGGSGSVTSGGFSSSVGGGGNVQQSQIVSQNSIVNQGNNSNVDLMSGTNSRLRIQNGVVVEATGIYSGYTGGALPGGAGGGGLGGILGGFAGSGSILEAARGRFRSGQDNQFGIFDHGPAAGMYDVGSTPCRLDDILDGGPGGSAGGKGGLNGLTDVLQLMVNMLKNFTMPFNINTFLDGEPVYKNQVRRYMGNLATFMN